MFGFNRISSEDMCDLAKFGRLDRLKSLHAENKLPPVDSKYRIAGGGRHLATRL